MNLLTVLFTQNNLCKTIPSINMNNRTQRIENPVHHEIINENMTVKITSTTAIFKIR